ncbi:S8 family serine peptidase [Polymorphospora lycopeni]|uniref:S8 family serine peptidase n=1 Tax=Polymorphospora lycopeni TaxID=3140240 RepID=A0ABV5CMD0_9ACTN
MSHRSRRRSLVTRSTAVAAAIILALTGTPGIASAAPKAQVNPELAAELAREGSTEFTVYLKERAQLGGAARLSTSDARAAETYRQLTDTASRTQRGLRAELDERKVPYQAFWIANALRVTGDKALVDLIAARPEVESIEPARTYELVEPERNAPTADRSGTNAVEWNITNVEAPRVWSEYGVRGEGVVIGSIDSGAQFDHPALVNSYRGNLGNGTFDHNYNWFDPSNVCPGDVPCDNNDHGTHTMGTMTGDDGEANQIGVAPGAKWMTAKGCESRSCSDAALLASGQWMLAPTDLNGQNPRPDLHADIINNSWGGGGGDEWYLQTVAAWRTVGMFPVFSAGNSGPGCNTTGSPGDYPISYAVGAYDINNNIGSLSSRGSSAVDGGIKPNIAAPGINVRSAVDGNGYAAFNGTSMAAPHVSGTIALIWSAAPSLIGDLDATQALLDDTATDVNATTCGGTADNNNTFGEGRLNAYQAVTAAPRGPVGRVSGSVTSAGNPVVGANVVSGTRSTVTGPDGRYALNLPAGDHEVTASAYGYGSQTATVTVTEGGAVTRDFTLTAAPVVTVSGKVTDGSGKGYPLYAKIEVAGRPGGPVFTNPVTGQYSFTVAGGTDYRFTTTVQYPGYQTVVRDVAVGSAAQTVDFAVQVDPACTAAGYSASFGAPLASESFDATTTPAGWSVVNRTASGGWVFDDPGLRGNLTGGTGNFAIIDSDRLGSGNTQDTDLISPPIDLSDATGPYLRFNSDFRAVGSTNTADVDVSIDGGTTWVNVWHQTTSRRGPTIEEISLAPAAGAEEALIRFRYKGTWAWWWQVDDVQVVNRTCSPEPGGLVVGFVTDANTGAAVNGATVTSGDEPLDKAVSAATPDDPNIGDGFYWLFSSLTGSHPFTATRSPYQPVTKNVNVAANGTVRSDFALPSGRLTVSPTSIESHQPYGSTRTTTVTVKNTGGAPATVGFVERTGAFELLGRQGAVLAEHQMKGISKAATGTVYPAPGVTGAAAPAVDEAWTRIANYPAAVFDNAAATLDGKVYTVGGGSGSGIERKAWVYDPETNAWTALPDMPNARAKPSAAAVGGKLYVIGGWGPGGTPVATVDVFDPAAGTWSTLAGVTNPAPRSAAGTAVVDGKVILVGGCADSACTDSNDTVIFDPAAGAFGTGADYPLAVAWMSCGGIGGQVYCAGGAGASEFTDAYSYDPGADQWSPLPDMPIDLWGSQGTSAGGLLVLAGGVTAASTTVTNRTIAYDPVAAEWLNLPNAQFARYRGAAACGAYKIGGSPSSFVGSADSEMLGGLDLCDAAGDVSWLSTDPTEFTLAPGESKKVKVTLTATAAAGVEQPGTYTAELGIVSDTSYPVPAISVEMNVSPPTSWGKVQGTVIGETCAGVRVGVAATVRLNSLNTPGVGYTLTSGGNGTYAYWIPRGRYEVIVAKDGWIPQAVRIQVQPGFVATSDFTLAPSSPCAPRLGGI